MLFQYQALAAPPVQSSVSPSPVLSWLPVFPDRLHHTRPQTAPSVGVAPFIFSSTAPVRVSQLPLEHAFQYGAVLTRVSQAPVEVAFQYALAIRRVRVSQLAVEIAYPFGCYIYVPPLPSPCPTDTDAAVSGTTCTAPVLGGGT